MAGIRWRRLAVLLFCLTAVGCTSTPDTDAETATDPTVSSTAPNTTATTGGSGGGGPDGGGGGGSGSGGGGAGGSGAEEGPGVPGLPGNAGGGQAIGSPIKIPSIVMDQGRPLVEVRAEIKKGVREQCGGRLCLRLVDVVNDDPEDNFTLCQFVRTRPVQGTVVKRGSTVEIVSGSLPCESTSPSTEESPPAASSEETST